MLEGIIGIIISIIANLLYIDLKRKGRAGFSRFILFWMGTPLTWLWLFVIKEGSAPELEEVPDDADALLAEVRRDRRLGPGEEPTGPEGSGLLDRGDSPG